MNTRHARLILAIVREGSFTAAARALQITQPTLSQTVRQIEEQLGEPVFVRSRTSVSLTPAGELYVQAARRMIQTETQLIEAIGMLRGRAEGMLRIGLTEHRSDELLPQVLADFLAAYPDMHLEVREQSAPRLEQMLLEGELDMALLDGESRHPKLEYLQVTSGVGIRPVASIGLNISGEKFEAAASGNGPVDAAINALKRIIERHMTIKEFTIQAISKGSNDVGKVHMQVEYNGHVYYGFGANTDIIAASVEAYIDCINKFKE